MGKRARWTVLVIGVLVVAAAVVAVTARSSNAGNKDISKITWAMGATIRGLEYTHSADSGSATVISVGCETLVKYDRNGGLVPALATRSRRRTRRRTSTTCARASSSGTASR